MTTDVERAFHMPDHGFDAECESDGDGDDFGLIPVGQATRLRANPTRMLRPVIPAQAGIQSGGGGCDVRCWTPAFAGVTE